MSEQFYEVLKAEFSRGDWITIRDALADTAIKYEEQLKQKNASDTEWSKFDKLDAIIRDLNYYTLGE